MSNSHSEAPRRIWTEEETEALRKEYRFDTTPSWKYISEGMEQEHNFYRSPEACRKKWRELQDNKKWIQDFEKKEFSKIPFYRQTTPVNILLFWSLAFLAGFGIVFWINLASLFI